MASPQEKVAFLDEAIVVLHGMWRSGSIDHVGPSMFLRQAFINPRPERRIPHRLGVHGEKMLEVVGPPR